MDKQPHLFPPSNIEVIEAFLNSKTAPEDCASLSELDGILAAVAVSPNLIPPSEWLGLVWGVDGPVFDDNAQAQKILGAMMAHYNEVLRDIGSTPPEFIPIFFEGEEGEPIIDD